MKNNKQQRDHTKLICDIGELSELFTSSTNLESFLEKIVDLTAVHMKSDVCSIYLFNDKTKELVLQATKGLNKSYVGNIKLKQGEGLTGLALKERRVINERHASNNPNFRYFPGLGEESFESFLAVPILRGQNAIGAMVIQNTEKNYFNEDDSNILRAITSQLANTIEMARLIISIEAKQESEEEVLEEVQELKMVKGKVGSSGYAYAPAIIFDDITLETYHKIRTKQKFLIEDFKKAVEVSEQQLEDLQEQIEEKLSDVASLIFSAQILMLKDQGFIEAIENKIKNGTNPPDAIIDVVVQYVLKFENINNAYLKEKSQDVKDVGQRLLNNLLLNEENVLSYEGAIVIARELFPSDALKLSSQKVKGIILIKGGVTGHLSLLARSLNIPLVITNEQAILKLPQETPIYLDAFMGNIYVNPSKEVLNNFEERKKALLEFEKVKEGLPEKNLTKDGQEICLYANINLLSDLDAARELKIQGIGLYRTEFPFIVRSDFPSEEEQLLVYRKLVEGMPGGEITFRTLDIGGDKVLSYFEGHGAEKNPFLGMRSIRFSLKYKDIFKQQIRAILRSTAKGDLRIMFPMISSCDEFIDARNIVLECINELTGEGVAFHKSPKIGLMIELPATLMILDELAEEADFFSIGTNDFIQYMLAVDRTNEKVAELYLPYHPSILRAIKQIVDAAHKAKIDVSICGDMAHEERFLKYFIGLGVKKFSVSCANYISAQKAINDIEIKSAMNFGNELLSKSSIKEIRQLIDE